MSGARGASRLDEMAAVIARGHGIPHTAAVKLTREVWARALGEIKKLSDGAAWSAMCFSDKAAVCTAVVKRLLAEAGSGKRAE